MSLTRACLSSSVLFVCLFVCNIFTCQQYFMPTVRCIRMRQQLPLPPPLLPAACPFALLSLRWRGTQPPQDRRSGGTTTTSTAATMTTTACNIHACLPQFACCSAGSTPAPRCTLFVQNCAHVLRNFSCVSMRRHCRSLCRCLRFACNKITVSVSRTQLLPLLLSLIANAMATTTKSKTQFSAFAYIFVTMSTSFCIHCPAHGAISHSSAQLNRNTCFKTFAARDLQAASSTTASILTLKILFSHVWQTILYYIYNVICIINNITLPLIEGYKSSCWYAEIYMESTSQLIRAQVSPSVCTFPFVGCRKSKILRIIHTLTLTRHIAA